MPRIAAPRSPGHYAGLRQINTRCTERTRRGEEGRRQRGLWPRPRPRRGNRSALRVSRETEPF